MSDHAARFWKIRAATLIWGFAVSLAFTGSLVTAVPMFATMALGNTVLIWALSK
jgi:hypothetical protein